MILQELEETLEQLQLKEAFGNFILNTIKRIATIFKINLKEFLNPERIKTFVKNNANKILIAKNIYNKLKLKKESVLDEGKIEELLGSDKTVIILVIFMFIVGMINPESALDVKDIYDNATEISQKLNI